MTARLAVACAAAGAGIGAVSFAIGGWSDGLGSPSGLTLLGLAVAGAGAVGWLGGRWLTTRIHPLVVFSAQLAEGRRTHLSVDRPDELGTLASTLNAMAERVEGRVAAIAEDRTRFTAVLSGMVEGVLVLDRAGKILLVNAAMERVLGCRAQEVVGQRWIEVVRRHELNELIAAVLDRGEAMHAEVALDGPEGPRTYAVQGSVARRPGAGEDAQRSVFVFHDVTALKRLERVRADFIANVSHELRTPLTSIIGYLEALLDGAQDEPARRQEFLRVMKAQADRINALVNDLLQLSQIESGSYRWRREPVDVVDLARRSVALVEPMAQNKRITMRVTGESPIRMIADAEKLTQVLVNLLDNAVKYTDEGGAIDVAINARDRLVTIHVSDTGIGIPYLDQDRIFERFYRVDRARSRALGGTGLGLSIVKHIVEAHGGRVSVESRLGKGSTFTVTIPLQTEPGAG
jgi:two-component system phosphate regulon sensor histidine kinase PhoR